MLEKLPGPTDCMKKTLGACERQWIDADALPVYCTEHNPSHVGLPFCLSCMGVFDGISLSLSFYQHDLALVDVMAITSTKAKHRSKVLETMVILLY